MIPARKPKFGVLSNLTNPPTPIGIDLSIDGKYVASILRDDADDVLKNLQDAIDEFDRLARARKPGQED